jgi:hypothetical protein
LAFAVRSTGCDSRAAGEPRVVAAHCARVTAHVPISNGFTPRQLPRLSAWASFSVRCSRPQRNTRCAANPPELAPSKSRVVSDLSAHRCETPSGDSSVGRKRGGPIVGVPQVSFPALAATGRRCHTRPAATPVRWGRREAWRIDFRALSSKTAGTVARDGCKQGLAVYSVRS